MTLHRWAAILLAPCVIAPVKGVTIDATLVGFDLAESRVFETVFDYWERTIPESFTVAVSFTKENLGGDTLGLTSDFVAGADGLPVSASVQVDDRSGSVFGWFVDPTPEAHEEFVPSGDPTYFPGRRPGPAGQNYDLLSILHHEMMHVLGFSTFYPRFEQNVGPSDFGALRVYQGASFATILTAESEGTHLFDAELDPSLYTFHFPDLMTSFQSRGERVLPSALDLAILSDAFGYDVFAPPTAIPEPGAFGLMVSSLLLAAAWFRWGAVPSD